MSETIRGIYRNGVIEPVEPLKIAEGAEVYVTVQRQRSREEILAFLKKLEENGLKVHYNPDNIGKTPPEINLGKIKGKPLSETIIEDRGLR
jgi:predicted DNA-binding antitoxin AbrB/MazE fold protein